MQIEYLNGLRGLCALWVVATHELMIFLPMALSGDKRLQHLSGPWEEIMANLPFLEVSFAVSMFFLLSAFVLSLRYWQQEKRSSSCLTDAACRRYIRLTGPVLGAMLIGWLLMQAGWMRNQLVAEVTLTGAIIGGNGAQVFQTPMSLWELLRGGLYEVYTLGYPGLARQVDFVLWTMPFELQGSFLSLAFLALAGSLRRRDLVYAVMCMLAGASYFLAFPLGIWLSDISFAGDRQQLRDYLAGRKWLPYICLMIGLYLGLFRDVPGNPWYDWLRELAIWPAGDRTALCHTLGGGMFLYALLQLEWLQWLFSRRWLVSLGHYSFSLYLMHVPVLCSLESILFMSFLRHGWGYGAALLCSFLLSLPVIALLVWALDRFFDKPAQKLSRKVARWLLGGAGR